MSSDLRDRIIPGYEYPQDQDTEVLGIFGNPIKHTLSPVIHDNLSDALGLNERYIPFEIPDSLEDYVNQAYRSGIKGLNITVPYKERVILCLSDIDEDARLIGAVNTLVRDEEKGGYKGYNTDMEGLYKSIIEAGFSIEDKDVIMLGAGGAARAVAYMCAKYGARKVYVVNRTISKAEALTEDMNTIVHDRKEAATTEFIPISQDDYKSIPAGRYIFIQCTSIGLKADDGLPLITDEAFYDMAECAVDLIYNPEQTTFLKLMNEKNIPYINGLAMLLYQGIRAYELWNNLTVSKELAEQVYEKLKLALEQS